MKRFSSLRVKLFIWLTALIFIFVLFSLLMNTQFLKPYYMSILKKEHIQISKELSGLYPDNSEELQLEVERIERIGGYQFFVFDENGLVIYSTTGDIDTPLETHPRPTPGQQLPPNQQLSPGQQPLPRQNPPLMNRPLSPDKLSMDKIREEGFVFVEQHDPLLKIQFLNMYAPIADNKFLLLSSPIETMTMSISIATKFFMFTGIITILIGSLAAYLFTGKFTKPIIELKAIAVSMSHLDFSHKYSGNSGDEIGELGSSINSLSDQLYSSISDLREANSKLMKDIERERKIDEMRKEFVSSVSHELKTPISLIQGYAEGLKQNIVDDKEDKNYYCDVIIDEAKKMENHVKELLKLSQIESGFFQIECSSFDLSLLITNVVTKFDKKFKEEKISLGISAATKLYVFADRLRIEQIIINYLNNAINHISGARKIEIDISERINNKVRLFIFNTGNLIPDDEKTKIWNSYYKIDKARTRAYGGSGLGLSIVKAIQEKHGNAFGIDNLQDGVSFWIDINTDKNHQKL